MHSRTAPIRQQHPIAPQTRGHRTPNHLSNNSRSIENNFRTLKHHPSENFQPQTRSGNPVPARIYSGMGYESIPPPPSTRCCIFMIRDSATELGPMTLQYKKSSSSPTEGFTFSLSKFSPARPYSNGLRCVRVQNAFSYVTTLGQHSNNCPHLHSVHEIARALNPPARAISEAANLLSLALYYLVREG
ncbi:hypothetical protein L873DRAFT_1788746 [Choiromyces venosus 120613-1]|uniref:Uncharacterized protein n=1 Tax=Choiromyces venosus 120613-1 TaxID=1336337 RepID=A0A3N4JR66_9PEZI|nr:hypothetical protein L873DRAFT_1788746 [Choiromyces venosus 120613-1]